MQIVKKYALVTGGAKRVGREIALKLAQKGSNILLHFNTSKTDAEKTAREIQAYGVQCLLFQADLSNSASLSTMVKEIYRQSLSVDILINSASLFYKTPFKDVK